MAAFFLSVALFLLALVLHIAIWRIRRPRATAQALIVLMVTTILAGAAGLALLASTIPTAAELTPPTLSAWVQAILAALSYAAAYVLSYPAIEVPSPTLVIITGVAAAEPQGLAPQALYRQLDDDFLVVPRIEDLLREGLAQESEGRVALTRKGRRLAGIFSAWRNILGAGLGG